MYTQILDIFFFKIIIYYSSYLDNGIVFERIQKGYSWSSISKIDRGKDMIRVRKDIEENIVLTNGRRCAIESIKRNMT